MYMYIQYMYMNICIYSIYIHVCIYRYVYIYMYIYICIYIYIYLVCRCVSHQWSVKFPITISNPLIPPFVSFMSGLHKGQNDIHDQPTILCM